MGFVSGSGYGPANWIERAETPGSTCAPCMTASGPAWGGLLVTRPQRTAADLLRSREDPEAVAQVIADALRRGHASPGEFAAAREDAAAAVEPAQIRRPRIGDSPSADAHSGPAIRGPSQPESPGPDRHRAPPAGPDRHAAPARRPRRGRTPGICPSHRRAGHRPRPQYRPRACRSRAARLPARSAQPRGQRLE
jgi:hypothetical protein